jgi:hypothetical protein
MTWRYRVQGVLLTLVVLGALALAAGADYIDNFGWLWG